MEWIEMMSLTAVLLLALYGCARLFLWFGEKLYCPRARRVLLVLPLDGTATDAEQQIRYAQLLAKQHRLRLVLVDDGADGDIRAVADRLIVGGVAEWLE